MPTGEIAAIGPLGNLNPSSHVMPTNHIGLSLPGGVPAQRPVVAPGPMTLTSIARLVNTLAGSTTATTEYSFTFQVCGGVAINFGHIANPSDKIMAAIDAQMPLSPLACNTSTVGTTVSTACQINVSVPVTAGEQIAISSGITPGIDFGAWNTDQPALPFLSPRRYLDETNYNVCPLSLFAPDLQATLMSKLGFLGGTQLLPRTVAPICGSIAFDVAGTASGNWWPSSLPAPSGNTNQSNPSDESGGVAFVADNVNPAIAVISVGNGIPGLPVGRYLPAAGAPAFTSIQYAVTPTVTCFDKLGLPLYPDQIILVSLIAMDQLKIEGQRGSCTGAKFTGQAMTMYR